MGAPECSLAVALLLIVSRPLLASAHAVSLPLLVQTPSNGFVQGTRLEGGVRAFLGVPFALPPVGPLRFRAPVREPLPRHSASDPYNATYTRPACPQTAIPPATGITGAESCLFLNVYAPADVADAAKERQEGKACPVMAWIHGGAYEVGAAFWFPGDHLVRDAGACVVVVTLAYRLGVLGNLNLGEGAGLRNFGYADQAAALAWVHGNVGAFGGDADRVTLFGESAGGGSVVYHLTTPSSWPLFARGIAESAGPWILPNCSVSEIVSSSFAATLNCSTLACLRDVDPVALLVGPGAEDYLNSVMPCLDTPLLARVAAGGVKPGARVILGHNQYEGNLLANAFAGPPTPTGMNASAFVHALQNLFTDAVFPRGLARAIAANYSDTAAAVGRWEAFAAAAGDYGMTCGTVAAQEHGRAAGTGGWYGYLFTHRSANALMPGLNATHSSEVPYVFNMTGKDSFFGFPTTMLRFSAADMALSRAMQYAWVSFARTGVPDLAGVNGGGIVWSSLGSGMLVELDWPLRMVPIVSSQLPRQQGHCDFWRPMIMGAAPTFTK